MFMKSGRKLPEWKRKRQETLMGEKKLKGDTQLHQSETGTLQVKAHFYVFTFMRQGLQRRDPKYVLPE